jgi:hypothetical protein
MAALQVFNGSQTNALNAYADYFLALARLAVWQEHIPKSAWKSSRRFNFKIRFNSC